MLRSIINKIYGNDDSDSEAILNELNARTGTKIETTRTVVFIPAAILFALGGLAAWYVAPPAVKWPLSLTLFFTSGNVILFFIVTKIFNRHIMWLMPLESFTSTQIVLIGTAYTNYLYYLANPTVPYAIAGGALYSTLGVLMILLSSSSDGKAIILAAEYIGFAYLSWPKDATTEESIAWFSVVTGVGLFALAVQVNSHRKLAASARIEIERRELARKNDELRLKSIEKDLELARDVQDSLTPEVSHIKSPFGHIQYLQKRHDILGGDWMGARVLADGTIITAVADVTGKGIPAAMVAQAINTVWALQLSDHHFEPIAWLQLVNKTVHKLLIKSI